MLVDENAKKYTYADEDIKRGDNWVALKGCQMDLDDMSIEDLVDWSQNVFTVSFKGIRNPSSAADTSPFKIEVFLNWSEENNDGELLLSRTETVFITGSTFLETNQIIADPSITTSKEVVAEDEGVSATFKFTPATFLSQNLGSIQITTPSIGSLYDETIKILKPNYPIDKIAENDCSSDQLKDLTSSRSGGLLTLNYAEVLGETTDRVTIVCNNWRNPISQEVLDGFKIQLFTSFSEPFDESETFSLDASNYQPGQIFEFEYELSSIFRSDRSSYSLSFEIDQPIVPNLGCYVQITFPNDIDTSLTYQNSELSGQIESRGLLADSDGTVKTHSKDEIIYDQQQNFFALKGCSFSPIGKAKD